MKPTTIQILTVLAVLVLMYAIYAFQSTKEDFSDTEKTLADSEKTLAVSNRLLKVAQFLELDQRIEQAKEAQEYERAADLQNQLNKLKEA